MGGYNLHLYIIIDLERCTLEATQNQNESFNNLFWLHASKTQMLGLPTVQLAVNISILISNKDREVAMKDLFRTLEIESTQQSTEQHTRSDTLQLLESERKTVAAGKRKQIGQFRKKLP